mmetsp:Transcript_107615/g.240033  ORF Transcript_107615/g.240033 Transcript_107615/m.240033 type:complete len:225 (+) Transcript_107615:1241-1915(+)
MQGSHRIPIMAVAHYTRLLEGSCEPRMHITTASTNADLRQFLANVKVPAINYVYMQIAQLRAGPPPLDGSQPRQQCREWRRKKHCVGNAGPSAHSSAHSSLGLCDVRHGRALRDRNGDSGRSASEGTGRRPAQEFAAPPLQCLRGDLKEAEALLLLAFLGHLTSFMETRNNIDELEHRPTTRQGICPVGVMDHSGKVFLVAVEPNGPRKPGEESGDEEADTVAP